MQLAFELESPRPLSPVKTLRNAAVAYREAKSILTPASGRLEGYDFALNPYRGCQFDCSYCYASFFAGAGQAESEWGDWVVVKENALELLQRDQRLFGANIYFGSATDPYQPVEMQTGLTRSLLQYMAALPVQPKIVLQTRSPLVTRDIDLFQKFKKIRVNLTIPTDSEEVRRAFEPKTPSIARRLEAVRKLTDANIPVGVCLSPMLPLADPKAFGQTLKETGALFFTATPFHRGKGSFRSGTRERAIQTAKEWGWGGPEFVEALMELRQTLPEVDTKGHAFRPLARTN